MHIPHIQGRPSVEKHNILVKKAKIIWKYLYHTLACPSEKYDV